MIWTIPWRGFGKKGGRDTCSSWKVNATKRSIFLFQDGKDKKSLHIDTDILKEKLII
jgi:hypothetical protein